MNFNLYIYGNPEGRYNQYPNDYTSSLLEEWQKELRGTQLVVYRKMNLVYYGYTELLNNEGNYIGLCVVFNNARVLKSKLLIQFFKTIVEDYLVKFGDIIKYSEDGKIHYNIRAFNESTIAFDKLKEFINSEFDVNESKYGIVPLDSIYNGVNSFDSIDFNATDSQILTLINKYNKVIIHDVNGAENSYLNKLMASLSAENVLAKERINSLELEVEKVNRQKKQYRIVIFLVFVVFICLIGLYFFSSNIKSLKGDLFRRNEEIKSLNENLILANAKIDTISIELLNKSQRIDSLNEEILNNRNSLDSLNNVVHAKESIITNLSNDFSTAKNKLSSTERDLKQAQNKISTYENKVLKHLSFIVTDIETANVNEKGKQETDYGGTIYSKNSMYLRHRIKYIGLKEGRIEFYIKLYKPNGSLSVGNKSKDYSYSVSEFIYEGESKSRELSVWWGNKNKGHWEKGTYKVEVWYKDMCLKSKTFTIY